MEALRDLVRAREAAKQDQLRARHRLGKFLLRTGQRPAQGMRTLERLVEAGLLQREQATPRAPWQIRRADLDREPVRSIIDRLRHTGKLVLRGGCAENQSNLFTQNKGDDNAGHHE
jgi:hypothetical protein